MKPDSAIAWDITSYSRCLVLISYSGIWVLPWWMKFQQEALKAVVSLLGRCSLWINKATSEMPLLVPLERRRPWFYSNLGLSTALPPVLPYPSHSLLLCASRTEASRRREKEPDRPVLLRKVLQLNVPRCLMLEPVFFFWAPLFMWTYPEWEKNLSLASYQVSVLYWVFKRWWRFWGKWYSIHPTPSWPSLTPPFQNQSLEP